jgi:hypothetical protein
MSSRFSRAEDDCWGEPVVVPREVAAELPCWPRERSLLLRTSAEEGQRALFEAMGLGRNLEQLMDWSDSV